MSHIECDWSKTCFCFCLECGSERLLCLTWPIDMCDMTHSYVRHGACMGEAVSEHCSLRWVSIAMFHALSSVCVCVCCNHCNTHTHTATNCNTLQHIATHCTPCDEFSSHAREAQQHTAQHTATQCNTLQDTLQHTAHLLINFPSMHARATYLYMPCLR